jgi:subtilisin family serine protease
LAGPTPNNNAVYSVSGTSFSSPFAAGVAALVWAANPAFSAAYVRTILVEQGDRNAPPLVGNTLNAYRAVIRALGGTPPEIAIAVAGQAVLGSCQTQFTLTAQVTDPDGGPLTVTWTSDVDGPLGSGEFFVRPLSDGTHHITATVVDGAGFTGRSQELTLVVDNAASVPQPTVSILSLVNHQTFAMNQPVTLEAGGLDPNKALGGLVAANVRWVSSQDGELGSGQRLFRTLTPGAHYIYVYYTAICGGTADDVRLIQVNGPADAPPNMVITTPSGNDLVVYATTGFGCLGVGGFGFDEEDNAFITPDWWETNRSDLQWKVLSFDQTATVCLKLANSGAPTTHEIRLRGIDSTGHVGYSAPLRVTVLLSPR